jgi:hypothetical protein
LSRMAVAGSLKTARKTSGAKKSAIPLRGGELVADVLMVLCWFVSECGMCTNLQSSRWLIVDATRTARVASVRKRCDEQ